MITITETKVDFLQWLSTKLYFINVGMYATIGAVMILPALFVKHLGLPLLWASFSAFFIVLFLRAAYESLVIYEAPFKSLSLHKMLILTFVTSSVMSFISIFLKPKIGYFAIPIAIIIAMVVVSKLKAALFPSAERPGFFYELPAKLAINKFGMYGFYVFLVGISYMGYGKYNFDFNYVFAIAFFIGMIFEESYNLVKIYNQNFSTKILISMIIWSVICAITASTIVWMMVGMIGIGGQPATIASVILLKLIQPLGSRKFILGL
ncbi:MAG: hypothetical protein WCS92_06060 [Candidatus Babeliales bacterium]|jgi:hypothetical protein